MLEGNGKSDPPSVIDDTARYLEAACCNGPPLISARIRASFLFSSFPPPSPPFVPRVDGERGCSSRITAFRLVRLLLQRRCHALAFDTCDRRGGYSFFQKPRSLRRRISIPLEASFEKFLVSFRDSWLKSKISLGRLHLSFFLSVSLRPFQCANLNSDRIVIIVKQFHLDEIYDKCASRRMAKSKVPIVIAIAGYQRR